MIKLWWIIIAVFLLVANGIAQNKISPRLQNVLDDAIVSHTTVPALVLLKDRVHISDLDRQLYSGNIPLRQRAFRVITALREKADDTQPEIMEFLQKKSPDEIARVKTFWVTNLLLVEAAPAIIFELSNLSSVEYLDLDAILEWDKPVEQEPASGRTPGHAEPGLKAINAPKMWKLGYTGAGTIVMNIDTGVDFAHPALSYKWRGNHAPASEAWFDPDGGSTSPNDCNNHGTHTMGIMTGLDPSTRDTIGVAFGAQWIAAKTICSTPHTSNSIAALQWAMDPDGNPSTIDDMPVAIGNSWWDPDLGDSTQCNPAQNPYIDVISAVEAAGIAVVFSAGNSGPAPSTITRPKNVNTDEVNFWATGAVDGNNPSFPIALFSSRGPVISQCQTGIPSLDIKPEASAPGVNVRSSVIGGGYSYLSGTSMACPHVVGALALLREAHPGKTGRELKMALYRTALDLGDPGEDNDYGMGLIDVYAAHLALIDSLDPEPPENFTAYSDYSTPASIMLSWDDPSRFLNGDTLLISDFKIMIERDGVLLDSVNGGVEQFPDSGLINGQDYNYSIFTKVIATDSSSEKVDTAWTAGGALQPGAPLNFTVTPSGADLTMRWKNPSTNIDGTPLIDFAGIHLYENDLLVATYNRSVSDSGRSDSADYSPPAGVFTYYVSAFDNDLPANESGPSNPAFSPLSIPFFDDFATPPAPVADFWFNDNGEVTDQSVNPPSPQYALMLDGHPDGGDEVTLLPVDLSTFAGQGLILSYFYQPGGEGNAPETGDSLMLEFLNDQGQWKLVKAYPGSNVIPFRNELIELDNIDPGNGASFFHPAFQLRFRNYGSANSTSHFDLWFVDDLFFGLPATNPLMRVAPPSIYDSVMVGETRIKNLEIMNHQSFPGDLIFSIIEEPGMSWLSVSPASGTIPSNQSQIVNVNIDAAGLTPGLYSTSLIISGNDTTNLQDTVAVSLRVVEAPAMGISPDSLYFMIRPGTSDSTILTFHNSGNAPLHILAIEEEEAFQTNLKPEFVQPQRPFVSEAKGSEGMVGGAVTDGSGGPDPVGYRWIDSDEPGGPPYQFTDISATGTVVSLAPTGNFNPKDEGMATINLPFNVRFYGNLYNQLQVSSNGFITFDMNFFGDSYTNQGIPGTGEPNNLICPFWDDLDGRNDGEIYFQVSGNKAIIQWDNWGHYNTGSGNLKFQVVLFKNSSTIWFVYEDMAQAQSDATVGIENGNGIIGLEISYNQAYIHSLLLTQINRGVDWLSEDPATGNIAPGDSLNVDVQADASGLAEGDYRANLVVFSDDPLHSVALIPVTMNVSYGPTFLQTVYTDWNILGLPLNVTDAFYLSLYPGAMSGTLFGFNGSYVNEDTLQFGKGYWLRFPSNDTIAVQGLPVVSLPLDLMEGWNLITGASCDIALNQVIDPDGIIFPGTLYGFDGAYILSDSLKQGRGYWIRTGASGQIVLNCNAVLNPLFAKQFGEMPELESYPALKINDASGAGQTLYFHVKLKNPEMKINYSMPPLPLPGRNIFDARFEGNFRISEDEQTGIQILSSNYPIIISATNLPANEKYHYVLQEMIEGKVLVEHPLDESSYVEITNPRVKMLKLGKVKTIPLIFEVSQNYPNPFNPETTIKYALPEAGRVTLVIYNTLGQKVRTLLSEEKDAGFYKLRWNGTNDSGRPLGSGVYFYQISTEKNNAVKKMILLR